MIYRLSLFALAAVLAPFPGVRAGTFDVEAGGNALIAKPDPEGGRWRVSGGVIYRNLGDVRFRTGSSSQDYVLRSMFGRPFRRGSSAGSAVGPGRRIYDNGYVLPDSTGSEDGLTWFWGYESASQVAGESIVFVESGSRERQISSSSSSRQSGWDEGVDGAGPQIEVEYQIPVAEGLRLGVGVSGSFITWDGSSKATTFRARQSMVETQTIITDRYGLGGAIPPRAPYSGTFEGPGPLLDAFPSGRSTEKREVALGQYDFFNTIEESLSLDLYAFSPGVSAEWERGRYFASLGVGAAINVADWRANHSERLYVSRDRGRARAVKSWSHRSSGTDVLLGTYVQAGAGVKVTDRMSLRGFVRYDWSESLRGDVGPSSFSVDLDGVSGGLVASWRF